MRKSQSRIISNAPGRICLFGDHQDYLNLPVIACAINRYIQIEAKPNQNNQLIIHKHDLNERDVIEIGQSFGEVGKGDFVRLALRVLGRYDCVATHGYDVHISGNIPINAGLSSSSALTVAWIQFLIQAFGVNQRKSPELIARLAYETEVVETGSSGGKMDQFAISYGDLIYLETKTDRVENLVTHIPGLIIGVSGISKNTFGMLADLKSKAKKAIAQVNVEYPNFDLALTTAEDISRFAPFIDVELLDVFEAAVLNHSITLQARQALKEEAIDLTKIGKLMNDHHALLKNNLAITVPRIDDMVNAALDNGALGAKIVGSGGGGCIVAMSRPGKENEIITAIKNAGAVDAFQVLQSKGSFIDSL